MAQENTHSTNDMWDKLERTEQFSRWSAWCAVVLAFVAGAAGLIETVTGTTTNVASIVLALLSGITGLSAKIANTRKQALEDSHKRTHPEMDVCIATHEPTERLRVVVEPRNKVPFEYDWKIVTRNDIIVSGIHLEWGKIVPNRTSRLIEPADFDTNEVMDNYIELRFDYRSIYAHELPDANISGKLRRGYKLTPDRKHCIPVKLQT
jgi:hypothetical protein